MISNLKFLDIFINFVPKRRLITDLPSVLYFSSRGKAPWPTCRLCLYIGSKGKVSQLNCRLCLYFSSKGRPLSRPVVCVCTSVQRRCLNLPALCVPTSVAVRLPFQTLINVQTLVRELLISSVAWIALAVEATRSVHTVMLTLYSRHHALVYICNKRMFLVWGVALILSAVGR